MHYCKTSNDIYFGLTWYNIIETDIILLY